MAGHDLLPGCRTPWQHDCPGYRPAPEDQPFAGMACHCPCHALTRQLRATEAERDRLAARLAALTLQARRWFRSLTWPPEEPPKPPEEETK